MVSKPCVKEALDILERFVAEFKDEKSGIYILEGLSQLYSRQSLDAKECMDDAFLLWLSSDEIWKVEYAIKLSYMLNIQQNLPALETALKDIFHGKSFLPGYFTEFLELAIRKLNNRVVPK